MIKKHQQRFIWIDLEMTGLSPQEDDILEVAVVVTDTELRVIAEGPSYVIAQPDTVLQRMNDWNRSHHTQSGLLGEVRERGVSLSEAEQGTLTFLAQYVTKKGSPMCGSSICQDRRFLHRHMPDLEDYFHYRHLDVSTLKILVQCWYPNMAKSFKKQNAHRALPDVYESIEELRFYRDHCFHHADP